MNAAGEGSQVWKKSGDFSGFSLQTGQELTLQCGRWSLCWNQTREILKEGVLRELGWRRGRLRVWH